MALKLAYFFNKSQFHFFDCVGKNYFLMLLIDQLSGIMLYAYTGIHDEYTARTAFDCVLVSGAPLRQESNDVKYI